MRTGRKRSVRTDTLEAIPEPACRFSCHFGQSVYKLCGMGGRGVKESNGTVRREDLGMRYGQFGQAESNSECILGGLF